MIDLMAERAFKLVPLALFLKKFENPNMALGTLLQGERLNILIKDRGSFRDLGYLCSQVHFTCPCLRRQAE
jgi:hypothetical protein